MLNHDRLSFAIEIQSQSFELLRWIDVAIQKQHIPLSRAEKHSATPEAAVDWISTNSFLFPRNLQPGRLHLREFANFFWTYLITSFDVIARPGTRLAPGNCGCMCPMCARIMNAPHLQPKKLKRHDKRRARELMIERIASLAQEEQLPATLERCCRIADDPGTRKSAGYSAYGYWLIKRLSGESDGPSVLALWREIAWKKEGSPIAGFRLQCEDFKAAENLLTVALQR